MEPTETQITVLGNGGFQSKELGGAGTLLHTRQWDGVYWKGGEQ